MKTKLICAILLASSATLVACGGSSSSSGSSSGSGGSNSGGGSSNAQQLPNELSSGELGNDAGYEGPLWFQTAPPYDWDAEPESSTIWAVDGSNNPTEPQITAVDDDDLSGAGVSYAIQSAEVVDGKLQNLSIDQVLYLRTNLSGSSTRIMRLNTNSQATPAEEVLSQSSQYEENFFKVMPGLDFSNPASSVIAISNEDEPKNPHGQEKYQKWRFLTPGSNGSGSIERLGVANRIVLLDSVRDSNNPLKPGGWLAIDYKESKIQHVALDGDIKTLKNNVTLARVVGPEALDGSRYVLISEDNEKGTLWRFDGENRELVQITNDNDSPLTVGALASTPGEFQNYDSYVAYVDGNFYFTVVKGLGTGTLYKVNPSGWNEITKIECPSSTMLVTDDYLVWQSGCSKPRLEAMSLSDNSDINEVVASKDVDSADTVSLLNSSRDNWVFYNTTHIDEKKQYAGAKKIGTNKSILFEDAAWFKLATSGNSLDSAVQPAAPNQMEASEAIMVKTDDSGAFYAFDAADPQKGALKLGETKTKGFDWNDWYITTTWSNSPGPSHLAHIPINRGKENRIVYFNTREKDSLKIVMDGTMDGNEVNNNLVKLLPDRFAMWSLFDLF